MMVIAGITFLALGSLGIGGSVIMEIWKKHPIYMVTMKIFAWALAVGGILFGIGLGGT